jgi:lipid-A-disaccharide synthase
MSSNAAGADSIPEILIVAGEASSALYAQRLLEHWRGRGVKIKAFGVGSRDMEALGFEIFGRSEDMAVVGIQEVLAHYSEIKAVFDKLVTEAERRRPQAVLLLDYPDFNLRLAKKLKKLGLKIYYYISPQVWAWRKGRIKIIRSLVDHMLVLFPFEKDFYDQQAVPADFVGHPLLDELSEKINDPLEVTRSRQKFGVQDHDVLLGLMPGSRRSELKFNLETQLQTAQKLYSENNNLKVALLVAPTFSLDEIKTRLPHLDFPLILMKDEPLRMVKACDVILCASGTATLIVGLLEKPMVIMYKMNAITAWIARKFVTGTPFFGIINLVLGERAVPELFQEEASVERLSNELRPMLASTDVRLRFQKSLSRAKDRLGSKGATQRVAKFIESAIESARV